ncbi:MAG: hypothetical protein GF333_02485 [Candidatus Omnitrophica bacterium]|nr:hypothetical protein [Candidatus Omnitrophota bacterium]
MNEQAQNPQESQAQTSASGQSSKAILKYVVGLVLILAGAVLLWTFRSEFFTLVLGCLGPFLLLAGAITIAIAKE